MMKLIIVLTIDDEANSFIDNDALWMKSGPELES